MFVTLRNGKKEKKARWPTYLDRIDTPFHKIIIISYQFFLRELVVIKNFSRAVIKAKYSRTAGLRPNQGKTLIHNSDLAESRSRAKGLKIEIITDTPATSARKTGKAKGKRGKCEGSDSPPGGENKQRNT